MKQTLLEMTQEILTSMDSDEVNSISDTTEANSVATLIRRAYYDLINKLDVHEHYRLFELEATSSATPILMTLPSDIIYLDWVKYNQATTADDTPAFTTVEYKELSRFLDDMYNLDDDDTNVSSCQYTDTGDSIDFMYYTDRWPSYYTTYNDSLLIFDAYDVSEDTNLQKTKTLCYGREEPTFSLTDDFTPDLDASQFSILVNDAKTLCFAELKQAPHQYADRESKRHRTKAQKSKRAISMTSEFNRLPNYGRK